jgi:hypothetical protein
MKDEWYDKLGGFLICFKCKTKFFGSNDGSIPKEKILCEECYMESKGHSKYEF